MCNSHGFNGSCCPPAQIFKEEICGNFNGPTNNPVWQAPAGDYIQGTFQVFNSAGSAGNPQPSVAASNGGAMVPPLPGQTVSQAFINPTSFTILGFEGVSGTYCITLYKRILA